jgi:membrane-associated protease RseP (regulator of RpoE activity)
MEELPPPVGTDTFERVAALRREISDLFMVVSTTLDSPEKGHVRFRGRFLKAPADSFDELRRRFERHGYTPAVTEESEWTDVVALPVVFSHYSPRWIINLLLYVATILSTLFVGAFYETGTIGYSLAHLLQGWPFSFSVLFILTAHEFGHYFAARYHNVPVSLPYFIPMPLSLFGTFGAFIQLRGPMNNRRALFDIGASGPLAGLLFAVPILLYGLATSNVGPIPPNSSFEGNSLLYLLAKFAVFGRILPGGGEDVFLNQVAMAGWVGLFVTGLNLLPVGQLDGGHVAYSLFGQRARLFYWPVLLGLGVITAYSYLRGAFVPTWLLWMFILFFLGRTYARPLEDMTELDPRRRALAFVTLALFFLVFVPMPFAGAG